MRRIRRRSRLKEGSRTARAYRCPTCGSRTARIYATMRDGETLAQAVCSECGTEGPPVARTVADGLMPKKRFTDDGDGAL